MKRWASDLAVATGTDLTLSGDATVGDDLVVTDTATIGNGLTITTGGLTVSAGTITLPTNRFIMKRWVSTQITESSIVGGSTSEALTLAGSFPATVVVTAAYLIADEATTSGNGATTTLTFALGVSGATSGYLQAGANVIGSSGRLQNLAGTILGGYRSADTLLLTLTTNGGGNTAHISNLAVRAVVYYLDVATE